MSAGKFLHDHKDAIDSLVDQVAGKAMVELPCLRIGTREEISIKLRALITQTVIAKFEGGEGCTGAWDTDHTFVVTVSDNYADQNETRINVALVLGESKVFA